MSKKHLTPGTVCGHSSANDISFAYPFRWEWQTALGENPEQKIAVNLVEDEHELRIYAALPGYNKNDIKVLITHQSVMISADPLSTAATEHINFHTKEIVSGPVSRMVILPARVSSANIKASYVNGVLILALTKLSPTFLHNTSA